MNVGRLKCVASAPFALGADRLHELLAVVRELEERVVVVVDDPDVLLGVVGIDVDGVRPPQHLVPLRPLLDDVARGVEDEDEVLPAGVDARRPFHACAGSSGSAPGPPPPGGLAY